MQYLVKICSTKKLLGLLAILAVVILQAPTTSALTIADILNSSKVLGASTSTTFPYPTASLVNSGGTIYFISGTTKVPFTNYKAFIGLGYSLKNVVSGDLSNYSSSQSYVINSANAAHPWGSWISYKKVVYYSSQAGMIGVPSQQTFFSNGGQWSFVVAANKYDVAVLNSNPALPTLTDNDPRVISQPTLQFGGSGSQNIPAVSPPTPVVTAPVATPATTTPISYIPQPFLPANIYASSTYSFSAPSADPNGPLTYTFTWDDGSPSDSLSISSASHEYYIPGVYMVEFSVLDNQNNTYSTTVPVTVIIPPNQTPSVPQFTLPSGMIVGQPVTVTASATDPQNLPLVYTFSWGDGSPNTVAATNSATYTYATSGAFLVTVTATNTLGFSNSSTASIYIAP